MPDNKIFIQIASYRDPELIKTIDDCLDKANIKDNLVFSIAHQFSDSDVFSKDLDKYRSDSRFKIIDIPFSESNGACWARNKLQQQYNKEEYTLQLDSHHRFIQNWDIELIEMLKSLQSEGYEKPLITGYIPSYDPENDPEKRVNIPWKMNFDRFIPEGAVFFLPGAFEKNELEKPLRARFYSAHFCFTLGQFCEEVQHDPEYYFHGEEISIAVRAFTHGYDLFHPNKVIAWHEYTRKSRVKQWDDDKDWHQKNIKSHLRNRILFGMEKDADLINFKKFGFGNKRTLKDYEKYAGLNFKKRGTQSFTLKKLQPPNPEILDEKEYEESFTRVFKYCINLHKNSFEKRDWDFWTIAFHNENMETIYRKDALKEEIEKIISFKKEGDEFYNIWREFSPESTPFKWVVWMHSSEGWNEKISGLV